MISIAISDFCIVLGGWTMYKWDVAGVLLLCGVLGYICSFVAMFRLAVNETEEITESSLHTQWVS
jgi:hypothetical protein